MSTCTVTPVDPHDGSALRAWYDAFVAGVTDGRAAPMVSTYAALSASLTRPGRTRRRVAVAASDAGTVLGGMLFEYDLEHDTQVVEVEIGVPPWHRHQGVGSTLWDWAAGRAGELGRSVAQTELDVAANGALADDPGGRFALQRGFCSEHVEDHLVLPWPGLPPEQNPDPAYEVRTWSGRAPHALVAGYADLRTAMSADVPTGAMTREARTVSIERVREHEERMLRTYRIYVALARADDGDCVGYTLLFVDPNDSENAIQDDTLVLRAHRGHGLGMRLKAANYEQVAAAEARLRRVHTWTAQRNGAMQQINARFGFRVVEVTHELEAQLP